jgi:hypothetical protein
VASAQEIDALIFSFAKPNWQKVAKILALTADKLGVETSDDNCQPIADRIEALVKDGRLEAQGDLKRWRFSEIRLPE